MLHDLLHHINHLLALLCIVSNLIVLQEQATFQDCSCQARPALHNIKV